MVYLTGIPLSCYCELAFFQCHFYFIFINKFVFPCIACIPKFDILFVSSPPTEVLETVTLAMQLLKQTLENEKDQAKRQMLSQILLKANKAEEEARTILADKLSTPEQIAQAQQVTLHHLQSLHLHL